MTAWIDRELVLAIHERQLAEHGGAGGIRNGEVLDSALARPLQMLAYGDPEPDLAELAAALTHGLARNHPFVDGNKRIGHAAMEVFLTMNGHEIVASVDEQEATVLAVAAGSMTRNSFAEWLERRVRALTGPA